MDVVARCVFVAITASTANRLVHIGTSYARASQVAYAICVQMTGAVTLECAVSGEAPGIFTLIGATRFIAAGLLL